MAELGKKIEEIVEKTTSRSCRAFGMYLKLGFYSKGEGEAIVGFFLR